MMRLCLACALFLPVAAAHAGNQAEEKLTDSVRTLLRQSLAAQMPQLRPFASVVDKQRFYRWRAEMSERLSRHVDNPELRIAMLNAVDYESHRAGLAPSFVLGVMEVESRFKPKAISPVGARGLMQVMPFWAKTIGDGNVQKLEQMHINIRFGCVILRHYLDQEKGHAVRALARYNGSVGQTNYAVKVLKAAQKWN